MHLAPKKDADRSRFILLSPPHGKIPGGSPWARTDAVRHDQLLRAMQRFRGKIYVEDNAIFPSDLSADGRHIAPLDSGAWHLLALDEAGQIAGSVRYVVHPNTVTFRQLGLHGAALAQCPRWGTALRAAVESEIDSARRKGLAYVEVGGWALAPELRHTLEALRLAMATFSLARLLGGCVGITTATERHCSSGILKRIGGHPLALGESELPAYYDPQHRCLMHVLRFESSRVNPRFAPWITDLSAYLTTVPVIAAAGADAVPQSSSRAACPMWGFGPQSVPAVQ